ncbi:hypothetical protein [Frateuria aurantia]|nr:hypothetical protein [Frateuria aurantia]
MPLLIDPDRQQHRHGSVWSLPISRGTDKAKKLRHTLFGVFHVFHVFQRLGTRTVEPFEALL